MTDVRIKVPVNLTPDTVVPFSRVIDSFPVGERYIFDLAHLNYVEPFGMLLCAAVLRRFIAERRTADQTPTPEFVAVGHQDNSYAAHMGFYQSFGLDYGKAPGQARGSSTYLPITELPISELYKRARYGPVGRAIEEEAERLTRILLQQEFGATFEAVSYALCEVIRNVVDHSGAESLWYAAQYWHRRDRVEIALLDQGIGIRKSLRRNPQHDVPTDREALLLAIRPGVSGAPPPKEEDMFRHDPWQNTGYGLFVTSMLGAERGAFAICSGSAYLSLANGWRHIHDCRLPGVALRLVLRTTDEERIKAFIRRLLSEEQLRGALRSKSLLS
jgi:hypothetical protein